MYIPCMFTLNPSSLAIARRWYHFLARIHKNFMIVSILRTTMVPSTILSWGDADRAQRAAESDARAAESNARADIAVHDLSTRGTWSLEPMLQVMIEPWCS
ncbi:hypothetical protein ABBQ38_000714 [Trebouxia sp. C0009 RCD-2024]